MVSVATADHHSITVEDIDAQIAFYRDVLGLELLDHGTLEQGSDDAEAFSTLTGLDGVSLDIAHLEAEGAMVELVEYHTPDGGDLRPFEANDTGATHFCFRTDDLDAAIDDLAGDVDFISDPVSFSSGVDAVYFRDPEGNLMEILERPD